MSTFSVENPLDLIHQFRRGDREPLTSEMWHVQELPDIGSLSLPPEYVEAIDLPFPKFSSFQQYAAATQLNYAGTTQVDAVSLTMHEDQKARSLEYFIEWMNNIQNPYTGGYFVPTRYKRNIPVWLKNRKGEVILEVELVGCWPDTLSNWQLNWTEVSKLPLTVNLNCDAARYKFRR